MPALRRDLGLVEATTIVAGSMIGSGIFFVPNLVAREFPSTPLIVAFWLLGGLLAFAGALAVAELTAMFPRAGGPYDFVREAFGETAGFLSGWAYFLLTKAAIGAAVAFVFAVFLGRFTELGPTQLKLVAVWVLAAFTFVNWIGVRHAGHVQNVLTGLKVGALVLIGGAAFLLPSSGAAPAPVVEGGGRLTVAFLPILFAYNAWINATFVAEEVRNPQRTLPRALALGVGLVTVLYVVVNVAYLHLLGPDGVAASEAVAADAADLVLPAGGLVLAGAVVVSTAGNLNGGLLTGARLPMALARDGWLPARLGALSRYATPGAALLLQLVIAAGIVLTGTFESIVSYALFVTWGVLLLVVVALLRLRRIRPDAERPYRVPLYPFTPVAFALAAALVLVVTVLEQPREAAIGIAIAATGVPVWWWATRTAPPAG